MKGKQKRRLPHKKIPVRETGIFYFTGHGNSSVVAGSDKVLLYYDDSLPTIKPLKPSPDNIPRLAIFMSCHSIDPIDNVDSIAKYFQRNHYTTIGSPGPVSTSSTPFMKVF